MQKPWLALYGTIAMGRGVCPRCDWTALIIRGKFACCDEPCMVLPSKTVRMSETESRRKGPSAKVRKKILDEQGNCCIYCDRRFGSYVRYKSRTRRLVVNWDHAVPWSYSQDNRPRNFVAACQVCNAIKADKIFGTLAEARIYVQVQAEAKGVQGVVLYSLREEVRQEAFMGKILLPAVPKRSMAKRPPEGG